MEFDPEAVKKEAKALSCNVGTVVIGGKEYKIPVQNANILKQLEVFKAEAVYQDRKNLDQKTIEIDGKVIDIEPEMEDAIGRYNLVIAILSLYNGQVPARDLLDLCDEKTTLKVYSAWKG